MDKDYLQYALHTFNGGTIAMVGKEEVGRNVIPNEDRCNTNT